MLPMIAKLPDHDHASPTNTNPPRISPHPHPTQRPIDAPTVFVNGTAPLPLRSHHITSFTQEPLRLFIFQQSPTFEHLGHKGPGRSTPRRRPFTQTAANHQQDSARSPRSQASEGTIARHQRAPSPRPTLTSILKSHKDAPLSALNRLSASRKNDQHTLNNAGTPSPSTTPSLHNKPLPPPVPAHYPPSAQHGLSSIHTRTSPTRRRRNSVVRRMYGPAQRRRPEHPRPTRPRLTLNPLPTAHGP